MNELFIKKFNSLTDEQKIYYLMGLTDAKAGFSLDNLYDSMGKQKELKSDEYQPSDTLFFGKDYKRLPNIPKTMIKVEDGIISVDKELYETVISDTVHAGFRCVHCGQSTVLNFTDNSDSKVKICRDYKTNIFSIALPYNEISGLKVIDEKYFDADKDALCPVCSKTMKPKDAFEAWEIPQKFGFEYSSICPLCGDELVSIAQPHMIDKSKGMVSDNVRHITKVICENDKCSYGAK